MSARLKILLTIFLLLAIFVRFYNFPAWYGFDYDQEINAWIAKTIAINHHLVLIGPETSTGGMYVGPFFNYVIAIFFALGSMNPQSGIVINIILSTLTISTVFFAGKKIFGLKIAIIAATIYAFSFNLTSFDRVLWNPTPIPLISLLNFFFLWQYIQQGKKWQLIGFLSMLGLMFHLHFTAIFIAFFNTTALIFFGRKFFWKKFENYLLTILVLFPFFLPLIVFDLRHNFLNFTHFINFFFHSATGTITFSLLRFSKLLTIIVEFTRAAFSNDPNFLLDLIIGATLILSVFYGLKKGSKSNLFFKLTILEISALILPLSFYQGTLPAHYFLFLLPLLILVISFLLIKMKYGVLLFLIPFLYFNFAKSLTTVNGLSLKSKHDAVKWVVDNSRGQTFKVDFISDPGLKTGFKYLFWLENSELIEDMTVETQKKYKIIIPYYLVPEEDLFTRFGGIGIVKDK